MPLKDPDERRAYKAAYRAGHRAEIRAYQAAWDAAHYAERKAKNAAYHEAYADEIKARRGAHYAANREAILTSQRAYQAANREAIKARKRRYNAANAARRRAAQAQWRTDHPDYMKTWEAAHPLRASENDNRRRAQLAGAACSHAACLALGPIHLAWQVNPHRCYLCGVRVFTGRGRNLHMDHVVPIARGGLHCIENLRPACASCNRRKGTKAA